MPTAELEIEAVAIPAGEIDLQLTKMLESQHFRHSQRYPALLRFLVEQTCAGNAAQIKERRLGIEVFHRAPDYDTNIDPVVRVTAAEVRKRIAQYYQEPEHSHELRIDLPTGTYVPRFFRLPVALAVDRSPDGPDFENSSAGDVAIADLLSIGTPEAVAAGPEAVATAKRLVPGWVPVVAALCLGVLLTMVGLRVHDALVARREIAVRKLWGPIASGDGRVLVIAGDHTQGTQGNALRAEQGLPASPSEPVLKLMNEYEQVPLSDVTSLFKLTDFMVRHHQNYRLMGAGGADIPDLRSGPVLLFAGLDNRWTMRLTQQLRFRFLDTSNDAVGIIADTKTPGRTWQVNFSEPYSNVPMDYAIVARYFDPTIEEPVMIVAGVGATGTVAASEFVTSERMVEEINKLAPQDGRHENLEVVLGMQVIDGQAGPPHILASQFW